MIVVSVLLAPVVMALALLAERRLGPSAGGWVAALPIAFALAVVTLELTLGSRPASQLALSAASHVPAQILFGLAFARTLERRTLPSGLAAGAGAYLASSLLLAHLPWPVAVGCALALLALAPRAMTTLPVAPPTARRRPLTTVMTCAGAGLIVGSAVVASHLAGPTTAGAVAAFPTMCTILTVAITRRGGVPAGAHALGGLVRSLPCYLTFCLTVAFLTPAVGPPAVAIGLLLCLAAARATWRGVPIAALSKPDHPVSAATPPA